MSDMYPDAFIIGSSPEEIKMSAGEASVHSGVVFGERRFLTVGFDGFLLRACFLDVRFGLIGVWRIGVIVSGIKPV